ncbi:hypothetical protein BGW38_002727, partial [Lunasporangiospora selenospora]
MSAQMPPRSPYQMPPTVIVQQQPYDTFQYQQSAMDPGPYRQPQAFPYGQQQQQPTHQHQQQQEQQQQLYLQQQFQEQ